MNLQMRQDRLTIDSPTGARLKLLRTMPETEPRAIVLIFHGLAEHSERYARIACELAAEGLAVFAHDHRGHGSTAALDAPLRSFARRNGAQKVVADAHAVLDFALDHCGVVPVVVLGHSMGGLIAVNFAVRYGGALAGLAIWNAAAVIRLQDRLGILALKVEKALKGSDVASQVLMGATIDVWSRSITPRRYKSDWLSHDTNAVMAFESDPLCGWAPTVSMALDLIDLIKGAADDRRLAEIPADLPIHLLGGTSDPATAKAQATRAMAERLRFAGSRDVTLTIVEGARHETLNEIEPYRGEAIASLLAWIDRILSGHRPPFSAN